MNSFDIELMLQPFRQGEQNTQRRKSKEGGTQSSMDPAVCGTGAAFDLAAAGRLNAAGRFNTLFTLSGAFGALALGLLAMVGGGTSCSIKLGTALL